MARDQPSPSACSSLQPVKSSHCRDRDSQDMSGRARHNIMGKGSAIVSVKGSRIMGCPIAACAVPATRCSESSTSAHADAARFYNGVLGLPPADAAWCLLQALQLHPTFEGESHA